MNDILDFRGKPFRPMLAEHAPEDLEALRYPVMVSPKLDGIRAVKVGGRLLSRKLLLIPNDFVRSELEDVPEGLDGELMVSGGFSSVSSAIMSKHGQPDFTFNVFDWHGLGNEHGYSTRYEFLRTTLPKHPRVRVVPHALVHTQEELLTLEASFLDQGFEGAMLRDPEGPYKHGRATTRQGWLLKLKRFKDVEAIVVGYEQLMHNANEPVTDELGLTKRSHAQEGKVPMEMLGALRCKTIPHHVEFSIGAGFTRKQRENFWLIRDSLEGRLVKYKHQPHTAEELETAAREGKVLKPRIPIFLGFRDRRDT